MPRLSRYSDSFLLRQILARGWGVTAHRRGANFVSWVGLIRDCKHPAWCFSGLVFLTWCFPREPVTRDEAEDYYDVIDHPMDFQTMQNKCSCGNYRSVQEFLTDVKQVFANAELYNCRGSHVLSCMEKTEQCLLALLQKHLPGHPYVRRKRRKFPDRLADDEGDSDSESVGQSRGRRQKK